MNQNSEDEEKTLVSLIWNKTEIWFLPPVTFRNYKKLPFLLFFFALTKRWFNFYFWLFNLNWKEHEYQGDFDSCVNSGFKIGLEVKYQLWEQKTSHQNFEQWYHSGEFEEAFSTKHLLKYSMKHVSKNQSFHKGSLRK